MPSPSLRAEQSDLLVWSDIGEVLLVGAHIGKDSLAGTHIGDESPSGAHMAETHQDVHPY